MRGVVVEDGPHGARIERDANASIWGRVPVSDGTPGRDPQTASDPFVSERTSPPRQWLAFVDQGVSSLTNILVVVLAAVLLPVEEAGRLALALAWGLIALGAAQSILVDVGLGRDVRVNSDQSTLWGVALLLGFVAAGLTTVAAGLGWLAGWPVQVFLILGAFLPALVLQDSGRYLAFAHGRSEVAAISDTLWLVSILGAIVVVRPESSTALMAIWGVSGFVALVLMLVLIRPHLGMRPAILWLRARRVAATQQLTDFAISQGAGYASLVLVGTVAGPTLWIVMRLLSALFGPVNLALNGIRLGYFAAMRQLSGRALARRCRSVSLVSAAVAVAVAGTGEVLILTSQSERLGAVASYIDFLWLPFSVGILGLALAWGPILGLRSMGMFRLLLSARVALLAPALVLPTLGWLVGQKAGLAVAFVLMGCLNGAVYAALLVRVTHSDPRI